MTPTDHVDSTRAAIARLDEAVSDHKDASIKNIERFRAVPHPHTPAACHVLASLVSSFPACRVLGLVEAKLMHLLRWARPEDVVPWIEHVGVFVVEVESHTIDGIRSFASNVPQVIYRAAAVADCDLFEQPKTFAFTLSS